MRLETSPERRRQGLRTRNSTRVLPLRSHKIAGCFSAPPKRGERFFAVETSLGRPGRGCGEPQSIRQALIFDSLVGRAVHITISSVPSFRSDDRLYEIVCCESLGRISRRQKITREFDPGSESTLAARLTHASRTRRRSNPLVQWRTGEEYMGNLPSSGG